MSLYYVLCRDEVFYSSNYLKLCKRYVKETFKNHERHNDLIIVKTVEVMEK